MPASTPTGITYPCSGDTIDCDDLQTYAETLQEAISDTEALVVEAVSPPRVWVSHRDPATGQSIAAGVTTVATYTHELYDTANMFTTAAPTIVTIPSAGTYLASIDVTKVASPTTLTSVRAAIRVNGVEWAYAKSDAGTSNDSGNMPFYVSSMPIQLVAGDQISATVLFTGSGNMGVRVNLSVMRISTT